MHMGRRLRKRLKELNRPQSWLAKALKRTRQEVHQLVRRPSWQGRTITKVAAAVEVDPAYFFAPGTD